MSASIRFATLRGSAPIHPEGVKPAPRRADPRQRMHVTVVLRSRASDEEIAKEVRRIGDLLPRHRPRLSHGEFERHYGARPKDLRQIAGFFEREGLRVREVSRARRAVVLAGTLRQMSRLFDVEFLDYESPRGRYCSHDGAAKIPQHFQGIIEGVLGLDHRPLFNRHLALPLQPIIHGSNPSDVSHIYNFPRANGKGQTIAVLCLAGGFHFSDIRSYFAWRRLKLPRITVVEVAGGKNRPVSRAAVDAFTSKLERGARSSLTPDEQNVLALWTIEATMDVELAGSFASGAHLVVYFAPNTARGRYEAFTRALTDRVHRASVHSCSWGAPETSIPLQVQVLLDKSYQLAALMGVTVCVSSGDSGHTPVNFPASSPHVLACGGTHLYRNGDQVQETVWNESQGPMKWSSSGGFSATFPRPHWQSPALARRHAAKTGRGLPDVAAKADIMTGYEIVAGGHVWTMGGTSAAAPVWAGLIARLNQKLGRPVGYLTPLLYRRSFRNVARDITKGNNGRYHALPGWDACTGFGAPDGERLLEALMGKS